MNNINLEEKKKKPYSSKTYTTGDPKLNIDHFNKMLSGKETNTHTAGYLNGTFKNSEAEKACTKIGTFASQSPDGASSISTGGEAGSSGESGGCCESFINESGGKKGRKVTRYFIKPQNIWCAKKTDIINALIDNEDQDCTVYTLINLDDNKDVTKLTSNDVIYYYEDGVLYDKNRLKVMDYDLYVKHEEDRPKININTASDATIEKVYNDRLTGNMDEALMTAEPQDNGKVKLDFGAIKGANGEIKNDTVTVSQKQADKAQKLQGKIDSAEPFSKKQDKAIKKFTKYTNKLHEDNELNLDFDDIDAQGNKLNTTKCCICGEEITGYGNNPEPYKSATTGVCCDACNLHFVIPARINLIRHK